VAYKAPEKTFAFSDKYLKGRGQFWGVRDNTGVLAKTLNGVRIAGRTLIVINVATDAFEISSSQNVAKTIARKIAGWTGAYMGAEAGLAAGTAAAGWGAIPGAIIEEILGYWSFDGSTKTVHEHLETRGWVPDGKE
jgi:hypothetical protein